MLAVDEDLRNRGAAAGAADHLLAPCRLLDDVDFGIGDAFALQQPASARAVWAEHRRVELDFGHCCGGSDWAARGLSRSSIKPTRPWCQASHCPPIRSARANVNTPIEAAPARFS